MQPLAEDASIEVRAEARGQGAALDEPEGALALGAQVVGPGVVREAAGEIVLVGDEDDADAAGEQSADDLLDALLRGVEQRFEPVVSSAGCDRFDDLVEIEPVIVIPLDPVGLGERLPWDER